MSPLIGHSPPSRNARAPSALIATRVSVANLRATSLAFLSSSARGTFFASRTGVPRDVRAERLERGLGQVEVDEGLEVADVGVDELEDGNELELVRLTPGRGAHRLSMIGLRQVQPELALLGVEEVLGLLTRGEHVRYVRRDLRLRHAPLEGGDGLAELLRRARGELGRGEVGEGKPRRGALRPEQLRTFGVGPDAAVHPGSPVRVPVSGMPQIPQAGSVRHGGAARGKCFDGREGTRTTTRDHVFFPWARRAGFKMTRRDDLTDRGSVFGASPAGARGGETYHAANS